MVKYLKPGQDFGPEHFSADFGFSSSRHGASGGGDDGTYVGRQQKKAGGRIHRAVGGPIPGAAPRGALNEATSPLDRATITMPVGDAARSVETMMQLGANMGARRALMMADRGVRSERPDLARPGAATSIAAAPRPPVPRQGVPPALVAKGGFIQGAVKRPGRMKRGAAREGVSTHEYMEEHKDSPGSLGQAARLGLRLTGGDLSPRKRKG